MKTEAKVVVLAALFALDCAEEVVRPTPSDCPERKAEVTRAEVKVVRLTAAARAALGEEAATLAWWEAREAEGALKEAREAARGCP